MKNDSLIYVAGHTGMVGSAIRRQLELTGYKNLLLATHAELALDNQAEVEAFFESHPIDYVFLAAAKVGGIQANIQYAGDFIETNLRIQTNVISAAQATGVKKLLFLGSSCIYPRDATQPISEDSLLTGPLEQTNLPYAAAKIAGKVMCDALRQQHGFDAFTVMPSNVYGLNDNFHPENSHLVAGMMQRMHHAKSQGQDIVTVWGTGKPLRELIFCDDLADACIHLMKHHSSGGMVNAGSGQEVSVAELAQLIKSVVGFEGALEFDTTKPDGTPRKIMDNSILCSSGWKPQTKLPDGLARMYNWFLTNECEAC